MSKKIHDGETESGEMRRRGKRGGGGGEGGGGEGGGVERDGEKRRKGERNVEVYKLSCNARPGSGKTKNPNKNPNSLFVASLCCFDFFFWLDLGNLP